MIITDRCNYSCPYCKGVKSELRGDIPLMQALLTIDLWASNSLENIRFSGGEPTLHPSLLEMVSYAKAKRVKRIAISTNGTADIDYYKRLIEHGVNDFSISLDACCASYGDLMNGNYKGSWNKTIGNIKELSKLTYLTVGMVFNEENINDALNSIIFADSLGVSDIRIITAAQYNKEMSFVEKIPLIIKEKHPILNYRIERILKGKNIRGIAKNDCSKCYLVLDDILTIRDHNYPCVIYFREGGEPISKGGNNLRQAREVWHTKHNTHLDKICSESCLDICIAYNNRCSALKEEQ
jgi:molybdenum cofactor biosynthesis enzyme MoaA